jgi:hypothetical protein
VAYYQVNDPIKSVVEIENVISATYQIAQTTVRNVVGQSSLDDVLSQTASINEKIKKILDTATAGWGIYVSTVELKDIKLPDTMQRAMARQAEAEREKRAKIIAAEGEQLSAAKLRRSCGYNCRASNCPCSCSNLQTLTEISSEKNSTVIFPAQFMSTVEDVKNFLAKEVSGLNKYSPRHFASLMRTHHARSKLLRSAAWRPNWLLRSNPVRESKKCHHSKSPQSGHLEWWLLPDSNWGHKALQASALPTELKSHNRQRLHLIYLFLPQPDCISRLYLDCASMGR